MRDARSNDLKIIVIIRLTRGECPSFVYIQPSWTRMTELDEDLKILLERPQPKFPFTTRGSPKDINSERPKNLGSAPRMTQTRFLKAKFVYLRNKRARKKQSHLLLKYSNMALVEFDNEELVLQPFAGQKPVEVDDVVSWGP